MSNEPPKVSPAVRKAMLDDFEVLENQVARLTRTNAELTSTNESLIKEVGVVREELDKITKNFRQVQAYATRLSTQLDVVTDAVNIWMDHGSAIKGVIDKVKTEAMKAVAYGEKSVPAREASSAVVLTEEGLRPEPRPLTSADALRRLNLISQG